MKVLLKDTKLCYSVTAQIIIIIIIIFIDCNWVCTRWQWSLTCYICTDCVG